MTTTTTFKTLDLAGDIIQQESEQAWRTSANWACYSCGTTYDSLPPKRINAGRGIRIIPGYTHPKKIKSKNLLLKTLNTKAGPLTIVTRHYAKSE